MIYTTNHINLYKKINNKLLEDIEFHFGPPELSYHDLTSIKTIEEINPDEERIFINNFDTNWTPEEHEINLKQKFYIKNPHLLFGEYGIVAKDNEIGFGAHIFSSSSFLQRTENFGTLDYSEENKEFEFNINFPKKSLRGEIHFRFFIYLKTKNSLISGQAKSVGLQLSEDDLHSYSLVIDGDGSNFPILHFEEKDGPLWKIEKNWVDSSEDMFDSSNIYIALNIKHYLFERLKAGSTKASQGLMGEIMLQSLSMIINEVANVEKQDLSLQEITPGTILTAVKYWVDTFEVQTDSIFSITNSLRANQSYQLYGE